MSFICQKIVDIFEIHKIRIFVLSPPELLCSKWWVVSWSMVITRMWRHRLLLLLLRHDLIANCVWWCGCTYRHSIHHLIYARCKKQQIVKKLSLVCFAGEIITRQTSCSEHSEQIIRSSQSVFRGQVRAKWSGRWEQVLERPIKKVSVFI